jgi:hypothetical protein
MIFFAISTRFFFFIIIKSDAARAQNLYSGDRNTDSTEDHRSDARPYFVRWLTALIFPERGGPTPRFEGFSVRGIHQGPSTYKLRRIKNARWGFACLSTIAHVRVAHGDRGYRYVHFEAGAIGHRRISPKRLGWQRPVPEVAGPEKQASWRATARQEDEVSK